MGPPGAGKGTQAALLSPALGIPAISTGDLFRSQVDRGTVLGLEIEGTVERGGYVSDDITLALVRDRLEQADAAHGFILDGYPRTAAQVKDLDSLLVPAGRHVDAVFHLDANLEVLRLRLTQRRVEQQRSDDVSETVDLRLKNYETLTTEVLSIYGRRAILAVVDASRPVEDVHSTILKSISQLRPTEV